jgi:hypothetical protein
MVGIEGVDIIGCTDQPVAEGGRLRSLAGVLWANPGRVDDLVQDLVAQEMEIGQAAQGRPGVDGIEQWRARWEDGQLLAGQLQHGGRQEKEGQPEEESDDTPAQQCQPPDQRHCPYI